MMQVDRIPEDLAQSRAEVDHTWREASTDLERWPRWPEPGGRMPDLVSLYGSVSRTDIYLRLHGVA